MAEFSETEQMEERYQDPIEDKQSVEIDRVGAILYKERIKKNIDLSEIAQKLCIRRYYLESIEKGEYGNLPAMPYSMGFVDSYAKFLGLNNVRIAQLFKEELDIKPQTARNLINDDTVTEARLPRKSYVLIGVFAIIVIAILWHCLASSDDVEANKAVEPAEDVFEQEDVEYYNTVENMSVDIVDEQNEEISAEKKETDENVSDDATKNTEQSVSEKDNNQESKVENDVSQGLEVRIKEEDTWLEVKDADNTYVSRIFKAGEVYKLPKVKGLILSAGKYDTVDVYVNGKLIPLLRKDKKTNIKLDSALNPNN